MNNKTKTELKKQYRKAGRKHLFLGALISAFVFLVLLPVISISILQLRDGSGNLIHFYREMFGRDEYDWSFPLIQALIIIGAIWYIGPVLAREILEKKKNYFWVSALAIISLWMILFFSSAVTSGIKHSFRFGFEGFKSAVVGWFIFGFLMFLIMGTLNGMLIGYFIGNKIKSNGKRFNEEITDE